MLALYYKLRFGAIHPCLGMTAPVASCVCQAVMQRLFSAKCFLCLIDTVLLCLIDTANRLEQL